jgi:hypothetical protein
MWLGGAHEQLDIGSVCVANFTGGEVRLVAREGTEVKEMTNPAS